jgi:hypothetical protein
MEKTTLKFLNLQELSTVSSWDVGNKLHKWDFDAKMYHVSEKFIVMKFSYFLGRNSFK